MADFTSAFWSWFIIVPTVGGIIAMFWLISWLNKDRPSKDTTVESMGHVWDETLEELNNPLPGWWLNMFYLTLIFGIGYLIAYPGLGTFKGLLGWTSTNQYEAEQTAAKAEYGPLFEKFMGQDLRAVAEDPDARKMGRRLFLNYCAACHGSDARGARGFPNLRDGDWLYGGSPEAIETTILDGRKGVMPAWEQVLGGEQGVADVADYVLSLGGRQTYSAGATRGKEKFSQICGGCHGLDAKGNQALGAPNLTDHVWLHGGSRKRVMETIAKGRSGHMPPHRDFLGAEKVHLLAAYVWGLSNAPTE